MGQWFSDSSLYQNHLRDLLRQVLLGPIPSISDSVSLRQKLRICTSNSSPGVAGPRTKL